MTDTQTRHAIEQVTFCLTIDAYAEDDICLDGETGATKADHDHYDVVLDQHDEPLFRVWPVGTVFATPDGDTMRLTGYARVYVDMAAASDIGKDAKNAPERPLWAGQVSGGGAFMDGMWLPDWDDRPVTYALAPNQRPAPSSVFVCPNGEVWRLRSYGVDWKTEPFTGDKTLPSWSVGSPAGGYGSEVGAILPDDARLVWHP